MPLPKKPTRSDHEIHPAEKYFQLFEERVKSLKKAHTAPLEVAEGVSPPAPAQPERKPHPGEEEHRAPKVNHRKTTYIPVDGFVVHYADSDAMKTYKNLLRRLKIRGIPFVGHLSFDLKNQQILTLTAKGEELLKEFEMVTAAAMGKTPSPQQQIQIGNK